MHLKQKPDGTHGDLDGRQAYKLGIFQLEPSELKWFYFPKRESRLLELKTWLSYYYSMNKSLLSFAFSFYWGGSY